MNKREQLITETIGDGNGGQFARVAAAHVRRRRAVRQLGLAASLTVALVVGVFFARQPSPKPSPANSTPSPVLEILSDQELLAQLKDQPVLFLKDQNHITGVIFLPEKIPDSKL